MMRRNAPTLSSLMRMSDLGIKMDQRKESLGMRKTLQVSKHFRCGEKEAHTSNGK